LVQQAFQEVAPEMQVNSDERSSASEDMALSEKVQVAFSLSAAVADATKRRHHHPKFDIDEEALPGCRIITQAALNAYAPPMSFYTGWITDGGVPRRNLPGAAHRRAAPIG
jgi:metal-dependent amidase/aminoacylase/carboxypeptidase family protein